jgi:hypothetical protein
MRAAQQERTRKPRATRPPTGNGARLASGSGNTGKSKVKNQKSKIRNAERRLAFLIRVLADLGLTIAAIVLGFIPLSPCAFHSDAKRFATGQRRVRAELRRIA